MNAIFYISAAVAILATILVIASRRAVHALLYFIVSLLAAAVMFYVMGAPFVAALEVIIYAGAIMVLFLFVMMMIDLGPSTSLRAGGQERPSTSLRAGSWVRPSAWIGPAVLAAVLALELVYVLVGGQLRGGPAVEVTPAQVGQAAFGPYVIGVELASLLLLAGLVGTYHLARRREGAGATKEDRPC